MIPGLTTLIRFVAFIHGEPARQASHNPQHFGADVGRVGGVADFIHGASN